MTHYDNYIINPFKIYSFLKIMKDFTSNYKLQKYIFFKCFCKGNFVNRL